MRPLVVCLCLFAVPAWADKAPPLPDKIEVSIDSRSAAALHARALGRFKDAFRPDQLRDVLAEIEARPEHVKGEVQTELKELRKQSNVLRSSYLSLDEQHSAPRLFDSFVRIFGKLNDAIDHEVPAEVARQARRLRRLLEEEKVGRLELALDDFRPTSKAGFDGFVHTSLDELARLANREQLPAEDFHRARKTLKNLLAVVHLLEGSEDETRRSHELYLHLFAVNEQLGEAHDALVGRDLRGKLDYERATIKVPDSLKQSIALLRDRYRNVGND